MSAGGSAASGPGVLVGIALGGGGDVGCSIATAALEEGFGDGLFSGLGVFSGSGVAFFFPDFLVPFAFE